MSNCIKLSRLLADIAGVEYQTDVDVSDLQLDSRKVTEGCAFVALAGSRANGVDFIPDARARGASAILVDKEQIKNLDNSNKVVSIENLQAQLSRLASAFFQHPSRQMRVVGVTGTNGKSTIVSLVAQLMAARGKGSATVGTLGYGFAEKTLVDTGMTTPDAISCQRILANLLQEQADVVAMEVSSHGIDQKRVADIQFSVAVLSNITRDHMDYHSSFEHYAETKASLLAGGNTINGVINLDDPLCRELADSLKRSGKPVLTYSVENSAADIFAEQVSLTEVGFNAKIVSPWGQATVVCPLVGHFNVSNVLAAITVCCTLGESFDKICIAVSTLNPVAGRLQRVMFDNAQCPNVFVDYAHTPDALKNVLTALKPQVANKLWVVFGCGGDRDKGKRPEMGRIAETYADYIVVTSDNPRTENPMAILRDIEAGITREENVVSIEQRAQAIEHAVAGASVDDCILIAGKGHENYQVIGTETLEFDDYAIALKVLEKRQANVCQSGGGVCH